MAAMKGIWGFGLLLAGVIAVLVVMRGPSHTPAPAERAHKTANPAQLRASRLALPRELEGVYLGMDLAELQRVRPSAKPNPKADEAQHIVYGEALPGASRAMYFLGRRSFLLEKLQVATQFRGVENIQTRVAAHSTRYGAATGIWDCPDQGASHLATRRFTWQVEGIALMDVYLLIGDTVSATLYAAPKQVIGESLRGAGCAPAQSDGLTQFPVPRLTVPRAP
jgi:hypothetical protein